MLVMYIHVLYIGKTWTPKPKIFHSVCGGLLMHMKGNRIFGCAHIFLSWAGDFCRAGEGMGRKGVLGLCNTQVKEDDWNEVQLVIFSAWKETLRTVHAQNAQIKSGILIYLTLRDVCYQRLDQFTPGFSRVLQPEKADKWHCLKRRTKSYRNESNKDIWWSIIYKEE